jgi:hypothetical protein
MSGLSRAIEDLVSYLINAVDKILLTYCLKLVDKDSACEERDSGC